uniref:Uncharacterized protein n=1 Tax=Daphnia galeata TaxID=27404 RepID=A0A8J2RAD4_9CRUS|nr:unnamed protein product [Daphnia galeata]
MNIQFSQLKWRVFMLLLALQALAVIGPSPSGHVEAFLFFKNIYKHTRPSHGYRDGPLGKRWIGFIKGHFRPPEYQYGPDEIPFILYS